MKGTRAKFEGFMSQLEQDIPFFRLHSRLKSWVREISNWYCISHDVNIEMPEIEHKAHEFTRELLFDALVARKFSVEHSDLMSLLFLHKKDEILNRLLQMDPTLIASVTQENNLNDLKQADKAKVLSILDTIILDLHPDMTAQWQQGHHGINTKFHEYMQPIIKASTSDLEGAKKRVKKLEKDSNNNPNNSHKVASLLSDAKSQLNTVQNKHNTLPKSPGDLPLADYNKFKKFFFANRDVGQCLEPVFARTLGHDKFEPGQISLVNCMP